MCALLSARSASCRSHRHHRLTSEAGGEAPHSSTRPPVPLPSTVINYPRAVRDFSQALAAVGVSRFFFSVVIYIIIIFRFVVSPITIIVRIESHLVHAGEGGPGYRATNRIHYVRSPPNRLLCVRPSRAAHKTDDDVDSHDLPMTFASAPARAHSHMRARKTAYVKIIIFPFLPPDGRAHMCPTRMYDASDRFRDRALSFLRAVTPIERAESGRNARTQCVFNKKVKQAI